MAIGDPLNAGIGSYNPKIQGITTPGVSALDEINKRRALIGMPPMLSGGLASPQTISGQTVDVGKKTGAYYDMLPGIAGKIADLARPPSPQVSALSKFLVDDPALADSKFSATIGQFKSPDTFGSDADEIFSDQIRASSDPDEIFMDSSAASKSQKRPDEDDGLIKDTSTSGSKKPNETEAEFNARIEREERGIFDEDTSGAGAVDPKKKTTNPYEQALADAMKSVEESFSGDPKKKKSIEDYKADFAKATGIDVSGEVDKSQALMAFGLALMQNKAGKGFNVGEMLSSVGAAGEKAMPALAAARKEAKTTRIKAAEFAISRKDKDQAAALNKQFYYVVPKGGKGFAANFDKGKLKRFNSKELYDLDSNEEFQGQFEIIPVSTYEKIAKELNKAPEYGKKYQSSNADISLFEDAPKEFQISVQRVDGNYKGPNMPERGRFNVGEYETYAKRLKDMDSGLDEFGKKIGTAYQIVQSDQVTTLNQIGDAAVDLGNALGLKFTKEMSASARVKRILNVIAAEKAPEILGEAGKTISDRDRERVKVIAGELTLTTTPAGLKQALKEMYDRVVVKGKRNVNNGISTLNQYAGVESDKRTAKMVNGVLVIQ